MASRIYLDHSATTPLDPRVVTAMLPFLNGSFGNPSSQHAEGRKAREAVETARAQVAALLHADSSEIIFTASGTEADNLALIGAVRASGQSSHIVTSLIEHAAVLETCRSLERSGTAVSYVSVNRDGIVDPSTVARALRPDTRLISIMAANNIVGTLQPITELAQIARRRGVLFHTDAVQAAGKIPLDVRKTPISLLSISAHKMHGPKGIGALYVRRGVRLDPIIFGGGQEQGLRSATENVAGIVGFGEAARIARAELTEESGRLLQLRTRIVGRLADAVPHAYLLGHPERRLPGHLCLGVEAGQTAARLAELLDEQGIAVSTGSACSSHHGSEPSNVLLAMGFDRERASNLLRVTLGRFSTVTQADQFVECLAQITAIPECCAAHGEALHV